MKTRVYMHIPNIRVRIQVYVNTDCEDVYKI